MSSPSITRAGVVFALILGSRLPAAADPDRDFSGVWVLDEHASDLRNLPSSPAVLLNITQQDDVIECAGSDPQGKPAAMWVYRTDGPASKFQVQDSRMNSLTKW